MDVGGGPGAIYGERAHAGALGFEMSTGVDRLIVNVGSEPELLPEWRAAGRATNGHSTLIIDDALSAVFQQRRGRAAAHPVGPIVQHKRTEEDEGVLLETYHDGYRAQYGYLHRRRLFLSSDGREIRGQDAVAPPLAANRTQPKPASFAIRFHLHPSVQAQRSDIYQVTLSPPNGPAWTFITNAQTLELEPSIYLSNAVGPQRARQIVLRGESDPSQREDRSPNLVKWKLAKVG
jgi:uncharacterized heparinase superfamily protein